jgi:hypothetical protein
MCLLLKKNANSFLNKKGTAKKEQQQVQKGQEKNLISTDD